MLIHKVNISDRRCQLTWLNTVATKFSAFCTDNKHTRIYCQSSHNVYASKEFSLTFSQTRPCKSTLRFYSYTETWTNIHIMNWFHIHLPFCLLFWKWKRFFENEKDFLSKRQSKKYFTLYCSEYLCFHVSFYYFFPYCHKLLSHPMFRESKRSTGEGQGGHTYKRPCGTPCNLQGFSYFRN